MLRSVSTFWNFFVLFWITAAGTHRLFPTALTDFTPVWLNQTDVDVLSASGKTQAASIKRARCLNSVRWIHVLVLVEIVVQIVQSLVALMPVEVDGVGLGQVAGFEGAGHQRHELAENADTAVPEGGLGELSDDRPGTGRWVVRFHHVRQLKRVVVTTGHVKLPPQDGDAAPNVHLKKELQLFRRTKPFKSDAFNVVEKVKKKKKDV